jgi:signal peptidase I
MANQPAKSRKQAARRDANQGAGSIVRRDILAFLTSRNVRETFESIVIAFALAFLFRTFEAEAFVIPTGSMAPTLQGRHQNVECPMCKFPYRISASNEINQQTETYFADVVSGTCPNCGYYASTNMELGQQAEEHREEQAQEYGRDVYVPFNMRALELGEDSGSSNGDRILVSKYQYIFNEPERWDVFVFRYPHNSSRNYIKRLVGLPNESLMIHCGDIFTGKYVPNEQLQDDNFSDSQVGFKIERKPPDKVRAMAQLVYDNDFQSNVLIKASWPHRWNPDQVASDKETGAWTAASGHRSFRTSGAGTEDVFLRYGHVVPIFAEWEQQILDTGKVTPRGPQLIADTCPYNTSNTYVKNRDRKGDEDYSEYWHVNNGPNLPDTAASGVHWVGDLMVETKIESESNSGEVVLELVEGGHKFQCRIDLSNGLAKLLIDGGTQGFQSEQIQNGKVTFQTEVKGTGTYELIFANVDDQLILWVDGDVIAEAPYDGVKNRIPSQADLYPVAIGACGAAVTASNLRVWRDVYYVAISMDRRTSWDYSQMNHALHDDEKRVEFLSTPTAWSVFNPKYMSKLRFSLGKTQDSRRDQFFALGDNSQQSKDSRLWAPRPLWLDPTSEFYVERELLIGKAMAIYWPLGNFGFVR